MNNSIEISSGTIIKILLTVVIFTVGLFLLNSYDKKLKKEKLESYVMELQNANGTKKLRSMLSDLNFDSIRVSTAKNLISETQSIGKESAHISHMYADIILVGEFGHKKLSTRTNINKDEDDRLVKSQSVSLSLENLLKSLSAQNADIVSENLKANTNNRNKKVVIPLTISEKESSFLSMRYFDRN